MSEIGIQNPFAPPRALVEDPAAAAGAAQIEATRGSRFLAFLAEMLPGLALGIVCVILGVLVVPGLFSGGFRSVPSGLARLGLVIGIGGVGAIGILVWNGVLVYRYGQTFGKRLVGIRVVRQDGSRVTFLRYVFVRYVGFAILVGIVGALGGLLLHNRFIGNLLQLADYLLIFRASRLCLHDNLADTRVVTAESSLRATLAGGSGDELPTIHF